MPNVSYTQTLANIEKKMEKPLIINQNFDNYLIEFNKYNLMMEAFLAKEFFKAKIHWDLKKKYSPDQVSGLIEVSKNLFEHTVFYPQSFRRSYLVQIFSVFEKEIKDICLYHHFQNKTNFSIQDLKGNSDIEKSKLYLTKTCSIDFDSLNPEWEFLNFIRKIRNLIVHSQGEITQKHKDWNSIFNYIKTKNDLIGFLQAAEYLDKKEFDELYGKDDVFRIMIQNNELVEKLIETLRSFFKKLLSALDMQ